MVTGVVNHSFEVGKGAADGGNLTSALSLGAKS